MSLICPAENERNAAFARRAEHVLRQRIGEHLGLQDLVLAERLLTPGHGIHRTVAGCFGGHSRQGLMRYPVLLHIAVDFDGKKLRIDGHAAASVPVPAAVDRMHRPVARKRAARVLVETDGNAKICHAGLDGVVSGGERGAAGRTAIRDVDELQSRQAQHGNHRVRIAGGGTAANGKLQILPGNACIFAGFAYGVSALLHAGHAFVAPERVHADADNGYVTLHEFSPVYSAGANA